MSFKRSKIGLYSPSKKNKNVQIPVRKVRNSGDKTA